MKVYLIINDYRNDEESSLEITAYATRELAEANIKPMIDDEVSQQVENGVIELVNGNYQAVYNKETSTVEITNAKLYIDNGWGLVDEIFIRELEVKGE